MKKGKTIAIYGTTNVGKTTQVDLLRIRFLAIGKKCITIKYPIYNLLPTGPRINDYLRNGNPEHLSPEEFQYLNVQNREDFESEAIKAKKENHVILLEMYKGTGIAYGMGDGLSKQFLISMNEKLFEPNLNILLDGKQFMESVEKGHIYEEDETKTAIIRRAHLELAKDFGWTVVRSDQQKEEVLESIWTQIV